MPALGAAHRHGATRHAGLPAARATRRPQASTLLGGRSLRAADADAARMRHDALPPRRCRSAPTLQARRRDASGCGRPARSAVELAARRRRATPRELHAAADGGGWFELRRGRAPRAGTRYRWRIDGELRVPDPASRFKPDDVARPERGGRSRRVRLATATGAAGPGTRR